MDNQGSICKRPKGPTVLGTPDSPYTKYSNEILVSVVKINRILKIMRLEEFIYDVSDVISVEKERLVHSVSRKRNLLSILYVTLTNSNTSLM